MRLSIESMQAIAGSAMMIFPPPNAAAQPYLFTPLGIPMSSIPVSSNAPNRTQHLPSRSRMLLGIATVGVLLGHPISNVQTTYGQDASVVSTANPIVEEVPLAKIDPSGSDWTTLGPEDFVRANCDEETWTWKGTTVHCTGKPIGVLRSKVMYKNLEFVGSWRHLSAGGNSGFFLWTPEDALTNLPPNKLPGAGIEVQVLDFGYTEQYEKQSGKKATWFTTQGDIFAVGKSKLKPFPPLSPDGSRSFPKSNHTLPSPDWNHYYVRAINGEVRLWVNGHEVSGGKDANPSEGYLCLESEGAPVEFKDIRVRVLP